MMNTIKDTNKYPPKNSIYFERSLNMSCLVMSRTIMQGIEIFKTQPIRIPLLLGSNFLVRFAMQPMHKYAMTGKIALRIDPGILRLFMYLYLRSKRCTCQLFVAIIYFYFSAQKVGSLITATEGADLGHGEICWYVSFENYIPSAAESKKIRFSIV